MSVILKRILRSENRREGSISKDYECSNARSEPEERHGAGEVWGQKR